MTRKCKKCAPGHTHILGKDPNFYCDKYEEKGRKYLRFTNGETGGKGSDQAIWGPVGLFLAVSPGKPGHTYVIKVLLIQPSVLCFRLSKIGSLESAEKFIIYFYLEQSSNTL